MSNKALVVLALILWVGSLWAQTDPKTPTPASATPAPSIKSAPAPNATPRAVVTKKADAVMPADAAKEGTSGRVIVDVQIDAEGKYVSAKVFRSRPEKVFDEAALEAAKKSEFKAPIIDGKPVAGEARMAFDFGTKPVPPNAQPASPETKAGDPAMTPLEAITKVKPDYPKDALAKGITGTVEVQVFIDTLGKVINAQIGSAEPKGVFEEVSLAAAKAWTFKPRTVNKRAVQSMVTIPFIFDPKGGVTAQDPKMGPARRGMTGGGKITPRPNMQPPPDAPKSGEEKK